MILPFWMKRLRSECMCLILIVAEKHLSRVKSVTWLVKPNHHELKFGQVDPLPELSDVFQAAHELRQQGIAHVVISLGEQGACGLTPLGRGWQNRLNVMWSAR